MKTGKFKVFLGESQKIKLRIRQALQSFLSAALAKHTHQGLQKTGNGWEGELSKAIYQPYHETNHPKKFSAHYMKDLKSLKLVKRDSFLKWHHGFASVWCVSMAPDPMCSIYNE